MLKRLLTLALLATSFCSVAGDWIVADRFAMSEDVTGYQSNALLFINKKGDVSIGFEFYEPKCEGYDPKLKTEAVHLVNDEPVFFKSQCYMEDKILFIPTYSDENWSVTRQFLEGDEVVFSAVAKRFIYKYSAKGFTEVYDHVYEQAQLYKANL